MAKRKIKGLWAEFKKFISRGNVVDLAIGVVIGGAFNAIVNSFVKILMSLATFAVPGGINGLVTALPYLGERTELIELVGGTSIEAEQLIDTAERIAPTLCGGDVALARTEILANYTLYGDTYYHKALSIIDWGTFINAIISFFIIALTLFVVLKVFTYLKKKRKEIEAKIQEEYYKKYPNERPVPPEPGAPVLKEIDYLKEISASLKELKEAQIPTEKTE